MDNTLRGTIDWRAILTNGRQELQTALALTEMQIGKDLSVLEIGCGMGRLTFALAEQYGFVQGIDISEALIRRAKASNNHKNVCFEVCDGCHIRPARQPWDIVFCYEVFHHVTRTTVATYFQDVYSL